MEKSLNLHSDLAEYVTTSSSFRQFKIKHFHLDLTVDFEKRTLRGTETLKLKCIQNSQSELLLDIRPSFNEFRLVVKYVNTLSFPLGSMENPCLTFITTCILAGDHSLADVIVHEMDNTGEDHPLTADPIELIHSIMTAQVKATNVICIFSAHSGVDPDDTYNDMPYKKGFCSVSYLAHLAGDQNCFDAFLKAYIDKFCSVMAEDALEFFLEYFPDLKKKGVHKVEFDSWLNVPGWPLYLPDLSAGQSLMKPAEQLSELWAVEGLDMASIMKTNIQAWKTYQAVYFLEKIIEKSPLPRGNIEKLKEQYPHIVKSNNAELRLRWAQIIAKNQHQPGYQHVRSFLSCQGKQMYTLPVYRALWNGSEETRALATELFTATSHQLHVNVRKYVKKIIA
uniref:Arginyl aminopeptidase (aminopeptidase B) n=1 Tax=Hucho hucho TaxID=62062 RepID=A0A4W5KHJ0_9TELE